MISIVLVDDHKILRQNIRTLLEFEIDFEILGEAGDGHEALTLIENKLPDIVVTDLSMPGCNGFELTNEIQNRGWPTRVIVLSMHANQNYVSAAFKRGAKAYVLKESGVELTVKAIREVLDGRLYVSPPLVLPAG